MVLDPRAALITDIDTQLRHYLGQGIDLQRTLVDVRYARDVLLVCDGMGGTDLPTLSQRYRQASQGLRVTLPVLRAAVAIDAEPPSASALQRNAESGAPGGHDAGPPQGWARNTSGFGHSHPPIADFNLSPHYGARDTAPAVTDRLGNVLVPPSAENLMPQGAALPWYSWRRWWFTVRT
jgi:hypothetical protein